MRDRMAISGFDKPTCLRPLSQPLYDTEDLPARKPIESLRLFQRCLSQEMTYSKTIKTVSETNLSQSAQIPNPNVFALLGFSIAIERGSNMRDLKKIESGAFAFTAYGCRILYQVPIRTMNSVSCTRKYWELLAKKHVEAMNLPGNAKRTRGAGLISAFAKSVLSDKEGWVVPFVVGRDAFTIQPAESFGVTLSWKHPIILKKRVRVGVLLNGIYYVCI